MEYISKDEIIDAHYNACNEDPNKCFEVWSLQIMLDMPTIDIVKCKDCIHTDKNGYCKVVEDNPPLGFWCRKGESK